MAFNIIFSAVILKTVLYFYLYSVVQFQITAGGKVPLHSTRQPGMISESFVRSENVRDAAAEGT